MSIKSTSYFGPLPSVRTLIKECMAGIITSLALIPEVISFSVVSGVNPSSALIASVVLGLIMAVLGGRPAMVTAAAGSVALVIGPMVKQYGVEYILPSIVLAGIVQVVFGFAGFSSLMRYVPRSVMIGFVNALGVLIFMAQVPHVVDKPMAVYVLFFITVAIVYIFPRVSNAIPSPLVAIVIATAGVMLWECQVPTVGATGNLPLEMQGISHMLVPLNLQTLIIIWPTALSVAFVGLLESLLTAKLVDELTDSQSDKNRESWALGIANLGAAAYGGIAGCAMIGQTVANVVIGGARTRISTIAAATVLLILVTVLNDLMARIPMVALAAVMMIVALKAVNWHSLQPSTLRRMPWSENIVMALTVLLTVITENLAIGVLSGVVLAMVLFARRVATVLNVDRIPSVDGKMVRYEIDGALFFGSSNDLVDQFQYGLDPNEVEVDFSKSHIWDASSVATLDSIDAKYKTHGINVKFCGLNMSSKAFHGKLTQTMN